jgi:hypothetical protein
MHNIYYAYACVSQMEDSLEVKKRAFKAIYM